MISINKGKIQFGGDMNTVLSELVQACCAFCQNAGTQPDELLGWLKEGIAAMTVEPAEQEIILPDKSLVDGFGNKIQSDSEKVADAILPDETGGTDNERETGKDESRTRRTGKKGKGTGKKGVDSVRK